MLITGTGEMYVLMSIVTFNHLLTFDIGFGELKSPIELIVVLIYLILLLNK